MSSWVWEHFKKRDGKAVCQYEDSNGVLCGVSLEYQKTTSSLSYHLVNVHGIAKGAPAKKQRVLPAMTSVSSAGVPFAKNLEPVWFSSRFHFDRKRAIVLNLGLQCIAI